MTYKLVYSQEIHISVFEPTKVLIDPIIANVPVAKLGIFSTVTFLDRQIKHVHLASDMCINHNLKT